MADDETVSPALGAAMRGADTQFAVYSETADRLWVCLFDSADRETNRIEMARQDANVWTASVGGLSVGQRYGLRADGRFDPGQGYHFDPNKLLVDPYARRIDRGFVRRPELALSRDESVDTARWVPKAVIEGAPRHAEWHDNSARPHLIYEINVRPFTMLHPAVPQKLRGTIEALMAPDIVDHIGALGVDVIELMPVAAWIDDGHLPALGLTNVWGYNPVTYFAPDPRLVPNGLASLRDLTETYRRAGIRIVLDVVYNHTGEGDLDGPVLSMKGLDAHTYYRHVEIDGRLHLVNDAGTGNTLQCDHPAVRALVVDSLKYWVTEFGFAGFRFDLATILGRSLEGYSQDAALLTQIRTDPILGRCLLIAEPWDTGPGGYQVGNFGDPFFEWNDRYRDDVRKFWKGEPYATGAFATRLAGSADLFNHDGRGPSASVNFLAAHDGFTLADLVAYENKRNDANGEENRDGHDGNYSWNNGVEGETKNAAIVAARRNDVRALLATLFVSRGTPMITAGDEFGRSQGGNNNAYAQDNETTWLDWPKADESLIAFVATLSCLRRDFPGFSEDSFFTGTGIDGHRDVVWLGADGLEMTEEQWTAPDCPVLGMSLHAHGKAGVVWFNRSSQSCDVVLPGKEGLDLSPVFVSSDRAVEQKEHGRIELPPRSVVFLAVPEY